MTDSALSLNCKFQYLERLRGRLAVKFRMLGVLVLFVLLNGCSSPQPIASSPPRPFDFQKDTFSYANELVWDYSYNQEGKWVSKPHEPKPDYTHHCFVVARTTKQFFNYAQFDASQPQTNSATYRKLVLEVVSINPRRDAQQTHKIIIPGYPDLRAFSAAHEDILKAECGSAWQSYVQRGHWRMILPFSRKHQANTAQNLLKALESNRPPVVHLVKFPQLAINHSVVLFDAKETSNEIQFSVYDPNNPVTPVLLTFDRNKRTFSFPSNDYWPGGTLDVYEIYLNWAY